MWTINDLMQPPFAQSGMNLGFSILSVYGFFEKTLNDGSYLMFLDYEITCIWLTVVQR